MRNSIDEFTITFLPDSEKSSIDIKAWPLTAEYYIARVIKKTRIDEMLGTLGRQGSNLQGYNTTFKIGSSKVYLFVAYNSDYIKSGITFRFTATGVKKYLLGYEAKTGQKTYVFELVQKISQALDLLGTVRLSRIDFTQDFINETDSVDSLYKKLLTGVYEVQDKKGHKNRAKLSAIANDGKTNTIYFGVRTSASFCRVYNKKREQLDNQGAYIEEAKKAKIWTRLEVVFRKHYAYQLYRKLLKVKTGAEQADLINQTITDFYRFYNLKDKKYSNLTAAPLRAIKNRTSRLLAPKNVASDFEKSKTYYLSDSSPLQHFLYRVRQEKGQKAFEEFLKEVKEYQENEFKPSSNLLLRVASEKRNS